MQESRPRLLHLHNLRGLDRIATKVWQLWPSHCRVSWPVFRLTLLRPHAQASRWAPCTLLMLKSACRHHDPSRRLCDHCNSCRRRHQRHPVRAILSFVSREKRTMPRSPHHHRRHRQLLPQLIPQMRMSLASDPLRSCPQSGQREGKPSFLPSLAVVAARASCLPLRWWLARSEARMASRVEATQVKCLSRSLFHRPRGVHFVVGPLRGSAQRMAQPSYGPRFKPRLRCSRVAVGGASASATAVRAAACMTQMRAHQKKSQKT